MASSVVHDSTKLSGTVGIERGAIPCGFTDAIGSDHALILLSAWSLLVPFMMGGWRRASGSLRLFHSQGVNTNPVHI